VRLNEDLCNSRLHLPLNVIQGRVVVLFVSVLILLYVLICFPGLIPNAQLMTPPRTQVHHNQNNGRLHLVPISIVIDIFEDQGQHPLPVIETHPMGSNGEHVCKLCFTSCLA
jgi:hypothetical protein